MNRSVPQIFDRALYYRRQARTQMRAGYQAAAARLFRPVLAALDERLGLAQRRFPQAAIMEAQHLHHHDMPHLSAQTQTRIGLIGCAGEADDCGGSSTAQAASPLLAAARFMPSERLPLAPQSQNLIVALWGLHIVNDLPGLFLQIARALKPDGMFLAALPGGESLRSLRLALLQAETACAGGAAARVHPFADILQLGDLLTRAGFARPVADCTRTKLPADMRALVAQLRQWGETNCLMRRGGMLGRTSFARAAALLQQEEPPQLEVHYLSGWAADTQLR